MKGSLILISSRFNIPNSPFLFSNPILQYFKTTTASIVLLFQHQNLVRMNRDPALDGLLAQAIEIHAIQLQIALLISLI